MIRVEPGRREPAPADVERAIDERAIKQIAPAPVAADGWAFESCNAVGPNRKEPARQADENPEPARHTSDTDPRSPRAQNRTGGRRRFLVCEKRAGRWRKRRSGIVRTAGFRRTTRCGQRVL